MGKSTGTEGILVVARGWGEGGSGTGTGCICVWGFFLWQRKWWFHNSGYDKSHWIVHFKWMHFLVRALYLKKLFEINDAYILTVSLNKNVSDMGAGILVCFLPLSLGHCTVLVSHLLAALFQPHFLVQSLLPNLWTAEDSTSETSGLVSPLWTHSLGAHVPLHGFKCRLDGKLSWFTFQTQASVLNLDLFI